jgi:hypothetical protein
MAKNHLEQAVKHAVAEWMERRSGLLQGVCQEVADELGPLIASEVVRGLAQVLTPTDKDREINRLKAAALYVGERLELMAASMAGSTKDELARMASRLEAAVGPDIPFNVSPPGFNDQVDEGDSLADQIEGGDA